MAERLDLGAIWARTKAVDSQRFLGEVANILVREDVPALLAEVERLRAVLAELVAAHYAPPWGGDDPTYEKALAAGHRMDAAWDSACEALEPVEGGDGT